MAQEQGVSPAAISKKEFNDVRGARLATAIEENPKEVYEEKAAAYVEDKERVKPAPRPINEYSPIRMSYRPTYTYSFAQKLKESLSSDDLALLIEAINSPELGERVEFEKFYNLALTAFNRAKSESGWGPSAVIAPEQLHDRTPKITLSTLIEAPEGNSNQLSLCDDSGELVTVEMSKAGGVKGLTFA
jgi:hypothetical protein